MNRLLGALGDGQIGPTVDAYLEGGNSVCDLIRSLRSRDDLGNCAARVPEHYKHAILKALSDRISRDEPSHVVFAGNKDSSLQLPAMTLSCTAAYTFSMWLNIDADSPPRGFLLFRCRCAAGGIDAMVTDRQSDTSKWLISLRSYTGPYEKATEKDETRNLYITLEPGKWHLVCVHHAAASSIIAPKGKVTLSVNGVAISKRDEGHPPTSNSREGTQSSLLYPFTSCGESHWKLAVGFKGKFASSALYSDELSISQLSFLYSLGPLVPHHAHGINVPQNTFDSGHSVLGSLYSKATPISPTFYWTTLHLANATLPPVAAGKINVEHIDLTPATNKGLTSLVPFLHGSTYVVQGTSYSEEWAAAGGVYLVVYLFWDLCSTVGRSRMGEREYVMVAAELQSPAAENAFLLDTLELLACLIERSADFKEQFIQMHGFHILAHCLFIIPRGNTKRLVIDCALVDKCVRMTRALGLDVTRGDGLASALQGLLLDFRVWRDCTLLVKRHVLENVIEIVTPCTDQLFRSIGVQNVLDLIRTHLSEAAQQTEETATLQASNDLTLLMSCADAGAKLLQLVLDAALLFASKQKSPSSSQHEPDLLLACLDEGRSSVVAERVLRVLSSLRSASPVSLLRALVTQRYAETTALALLSTRGLSLAVRRDALVLLLWGLGEYLKKVPLDLVQLRNANGNLAAPPMPEPKRATSGRKAAAVAAAALESKSARSREISRPLEKAWLAVSVLSECINQAILDGSWGDLQAPSAQQMYEEVVCVLAHDGPLGCVNVWLVLPLLNVLLPKQRCSLAICQRVLMSTNVALKMDEAQCEALGALSDRLWCRQFVDLAALGEVHRVASSSSTLLMPSSSMERDVADTCAELALDALSTVLEQKTRHHAYESHETWNCVQTCLTAGCQVFEDRASDVELRFLKRCVSLVFQRLARSSEGWNATLISSVVNILALVEHRRLYCCNQKARQQTPDEQQILCFMLDMMGGLRRASANGALEGIERRALRPGTRITLGCLLCASDDIADRLCVELMASLQFMSELWGAPQGPNGQKSFREFVVLILSQVRGAIEDNTVDENVRGRYSALIYHIMHFFLDMRHNLAGRGVPSHVVPMLDALTGIDTQKDVDIIFQLLEERLHIISAPSLNSFSEAESATEAALSPSASSVASSSAGDLVEGLSSSPVNDTGAAGLELESDGATSTVGNLLDIDYLPTSPTVSQHPSLGAETEETDPALQALHTRWLTVRRGILADRADSERARLARSNKSLEVASEASARHWARLHRKIESEYFLENEVSDWKLGVAHEGPFPGRRRVILRPRYNKFSTAGDANKKIKRIGEAASPRNEAPTDVLIVGRELARVYRSNSRAVAGLETSQDELDEKVEEEQDETAGTGWGLVDADGSDEGYGVVGIAPQGQSEATQGTNSPENEGDLNGDVKQIDDSFYPGRGPETGPALPGTRKMGSNKATLEARVMLVTASGNTWGTLSFNGREIFFASKAEPGRRDENNDTASINLASVPRMRRRRWALSTVSAVYLRRYRLRNSAIEVFFRRGKHRNFFVDFGHTDEDEKAKNTFAEALMKAAPRSAFLQWPTTSQFSLVRLHGVQSKWLNGEISNFEYLMALNTISGRSFNDLCQYPVMPWIIAQYTLPTIDLRSPQTFRDLSKPMGALEESRLKEFMERYESFGESDSSEIPAFMYGSHYSTMVGVVLHFLMRVQPYADLHRDMQGGRFDVADRLFSSIPRTWMQNTTQLSEVKELTPEWFTTPDVFKNVNKFDLGKTQEGEVIGDVTLPPWASSAEEFVRINREALESDYVSAHLHEWIDLIFGYKQQLPYSEKAHNVFYFLTYADCVDWKQLAQDETLRAATELQISHFGQTPMQLFNIQHPKRGATFFSRSVPRPLRKCFSMTKTSRPRMALPTTVDEAASTGSRSVLTKTASSGSTLLASPALAVSISPMRLVCILESGTVEVIRFGVSESAKSAIAASASRAKQRSSTHHEIDDHLPLPASICGEIVSSILEPLVSLEREAPPPEMRLQTRVPMPSNLSAERLTSVVLVTPSGRYCLTGGMIDGSVCVRELDYKSGFVKSEGDFRSHCSPVLFIASDTIPNATTDVIATCDASGLVFVWTVSEIRHQIGNQIDLFERESVISRRPQRLFRCRKCAEICCDISCKMGIVVVCCGTDVHVFSIERDERLRLFYAKGEGAGTERESSAFEATDAMPRRTIRRVTLCNDGVVIVHVEVSMSPLIEGFETAKEHKLEAYSLSGSFIASRASTPVTFLQCPCREDVLISGHQDGSVNIFCAHNLALLFSFQPHSSFLFAAVPPGELTGVGAGAGIESSIYPSPVICAKVGPSPERPTLLVVSCQSGDLYLRPLPDFVKWERQRSPSALSQLVERPLEVVRGTIQHAHQLGTTISSNVEAFKHNASRLADDALSELKKSNLFRTLFKPGGK